MSDPYRPGAITITNVYLAADHEPDTFAIWIVVNSTHRQPYARGLPEAQAMREYEVFNRLLHGMVTKVEKAT